MVNEPKSDLKVDQEKEGKPFYMPLDPTWIEDMPQSVGTVVSTGESVETGEQGCSIPCGVPSVSETFLPPIQFSRSGSPHSEYSTTPSSVSTPVESELQLSGNTPHGSPSIEKRVLRPRDSRGFVKKSLKF
ncbi:microtubule-binding protein tangled1-like protein [Lasius niger]|uniref:Microtubule-binding protein tangled1-like protein n=1 Tax=Lasius niger TaxID=67767 RepID=A0A0J7K0K7_LASNI|nr:microtubule-binding protein tangled1-like protein [Lasius niger]